MVELRVPPGADLVAVLKHPDEGKAEDEKVEAHPEISAAVYPAFLLLFEHVKKNNSTLHVQGLIGSGGVHAHSSHLFAFLHAAKNAGITRVAIHIFTDGRDTPPQSAGTYIEELEDEIQHIGVGFIATVSGRFYAMDRDHNWDRTKRAEEALFECKGNVCSIKPSAYVRTLYAEKKT